jgi:hypothetical protein
MSRFPLVAQARGHELSLATQTGLGLAGGQTRIETNRGVSRADARNARLGVTHSLHTRRLAPHAVEFWQTLHNPSNAELAVKQIVMLDANLELAGRGWKVMHAELFHGDFHAIGNLHHFTDGLFMAVPGATGRWGLSEDMPFPGLFFTHPERGTLLLATLSQERCKPVFELTGARAMRLRCIDAFGGIATIPVPGGTEFQSERWVALFHPLGVAEVIDAYYQVLSKRFRFLGRDSVLRDEIVWTSYNFNPRPRGEHDIDHAYIAANARAMSRLLRKPCWIGIDVGYGYDYARERIVEGKRIGPTRGPDMFYPGVTPHDARLFPRGMDGIVRDIRKGGAKPALWFPPGIFCNSRMARENPDWILPGLTEPVYPHGWGRGSAYLDYSIPEVRQYMRRCWETIFDRWGFMGIKLDFFYNMFEFNGLNYRVPGKTAVELRNMMFAEIRSFVPRGGYFMACHNVAGNPFIGRYADACRMSPDAGNEWRITHRAAMWMTRTSLFFRNNCLLADGEGFLWNTHMNAHETRTGATLTLMAGAMAELAGDLTNLPPWGRDMVRRYGQLFAPSRRSWNSALDGNCLSMPAGDWRLEREDGRVFEAKFNWWDHHPRQVEFDRPVTDLWTGKRLRGTHLIDPRGCLMFER